MSKKQFEIDLNKQIELMKTEARYHPQYLIQMVSEKGGYAAAKELISKEINTEGFTKLLLAGKKHLSIEALVVRPEYRELFTKKELEGCCKRLGIKNL